MVQKSDCHHDLRSSHQTNVDLPPWHVDLSPCKDTSCDYNAQCWQVLNVQNIYTNIYSAKRLPPVGIKPGTLGLLVAQLVLHSHAFLTFCWINFALFSSLYYHHDLWTNHQGNVDFWNQTCCNMFAIFSPGWLIHPMYDSFSDHVWLYFLDLSEKVFTNVSHVVVRRRRRDSGFSR